MRFAWPTTCAGTEPDRRRAGGNPLLFDDSDGEKVCDFGLLQVLGPRPETADLAVVVFMKAVLIVKGGSVGRLRDGPWINILAGIRAQLEDRFGDRVLLLEPCPLCGREAEAPKLDPRAAYTLTHSGLARR